MTTSLDGKIYAAVWGEDPRVLKLLDKYEETHQALGVKAWIVGRTTMERDFTDYEKPILSKVTAAIPREDFNAAGTATTFSIVIDGSAKLGWKEAKVETGEHVVTILTESIPDGYLQHLREIGLSYIFAGKEKIDLRLALEKLRTVFGIEHLFLEGGGNINGTFLNEGLIDEYHHLLLPLVDGRRDMTGVFEINDDVRKAPFSLLKLKSVTPLEDDVLWLTYDLRQGC
jgi:riboflavin biosynthesis pyrimidine reductase